MSWTDFPAPNRWSAGEFLPAADLNLFLQDNTQFLKLNIALEEPVALGVSATDTITITQSFHEIEEAGAGSEVATIALGTDITGTDDGRLLILRAAAGETITLVTTGNLAIGSNIVLDNPAKYVMLIGEDGTWRLLAYTRSTLVTSGTGTISSDTVQIAHNLGQIPTRVLITPTSPLGGSEIWVSDKEVDAAGDPGTTHFQVTADPAPYESDITFDWRAWVGEGI